MKKIIALSLVIMFLLPQISFAAWWNPLSWFKDGGVKAERVEMKIEDDSSQNQEEVINEVNDLTREDKERKSEVIERVITKEIEVPREKIVEKIVTVSDQKVIEENGFLKNQIDQLTKASAQCLSDLELSKQKIKLLETAKVDESGKKKIITDQINAIDLEISMVRAGYNDTALKGNCRYDCLTIEELRDTKVKQLDVKKTQLIQQLGAL